MGKQGYSVEAPGPLMLPSTYTGGVRLDSQPIQGAPLADPLWDYGVIVWTFMGARVTRTSSTGSDEMIVLPYWLSSLCCLISPLRWCLDRK